MSSASDDARDAALWRVFDEPGRKWTAWIGHTSADGYTVWPVFAAQSLSAAVAALAARNEGRRQRVTESTAASVGSGVSDHMNQTEGRA